MRLPLVIAANAARLAGALSRRLGKGGGTSLPGMVANRLRPGLAGELAAPLSLGSLTISATNGKTTTARMLASITEANHLTVVANTAGANLITGVTAALLEAPGDAEFGLFEVDEAALPAVAEQLQPRVIVLMNLFRDQLDRFGELETLATMWDDLVATLGPETTLVLNIDDPAIAWLRHQHRGPVLTFGAGPAIGTVHGLSHASDSTTCRRCDAELVYDTVTLAHLGHWRCPNGDEVRPDPDVVMTAVDLDGVTGLTLSLATPDGAVTSTIGLPGLHNAYNAAAATAAAIAVGLPLDSIGPALATTEAAFGRAERVAVDGTDLVLLLAKNPAGANQNISTVLLDPEPLHVMVLLNDRTADGRDVSWIWDVDYEPLFGQLASLTVAGDRAHDLALRFQYGGFPADRITVVPDPGDALDTALGASEGAPVYVLPTYTAMLDLRSILTNRGVVADFWKDEE